MYLVIRICSRLCRVTTLRLRLAKGVRATANRATAYTNTSTGKRMPICLLSMGKSDPTCIVSSNDTANIIKLATQYSADNIYANDNKMKKKLNYLSNFLLGLNENKTLVDTRYAALNTAIYSDLTDYWTQSNFKFKMNKYLENHLSIENSVLDACNNIIADANGLKNIDIKSKITHVITHSDGPSAIPPMATRIIRGLGLSSSCSPISLQNHACGGGSVAMSLSKTICESDENALVLFIGFQTVSTGFDWFNQISDTENMSKLRSYYIANIVFGDAFVGFLVGRPSVKEIDPNKYPLFKVNNSLDRLLPEHTSRLAHYWSSVQNMDIKPKIAGFYIDQLLAPEVYESMVSKEFDLESLLRQHVISNDLNDCDYSFHAGGVSILKALKKMMKLKGLNNTHQAMSIPYRILSKYGNVGACSGLLVLDETIRSTKKDNICHITIAPGVSIHTHGFTQLDKCLINDGLWK